MNKKRKNIQLIITTIIFVLGLKLYYLFTMSNLEKSPVYIMSFFHDSLLIIINYWVFIGLSKFKRLKVFPNIILFSIHLFLLLFFILYTPLILDILSFPTNIFRANSSMAGFMLEYFVGIKTISTTVVAFIFIYLTNRYFIFDAKKRIYSLSLIVVFILGIISLGKSVNPILYSIGDEVRFILNPHKTTANLEKLTNPVVSNDSIDFSFLNKRFIDVPIMEITYNKVIVLVMETMNNDMYTKAQEDFPLDFIHQSHLFTNYYTPNLDSYTALIAMLNSIYVPYQSYTNTDKYTFLNEQNNLVKFFNTNGYFTSFLIPAASHHIRFTPNPDDWDKIVFHNDFDLDDYTCVTSSKIEMACEDLVVFDDTIDILKNNKKAFVFHEMVYGHTSEWFSKTGITTEEYYNAYFNKMVAELKSENLWEKSLLIIIADHGPRLNPQNVEDYNIPLLFCADDLESLENSTLYSQIDFKDILLNYITDSPKPKERDIIYTIGNSGELVYGMITRNGNYAFIDNSYLDATTNISNAELERFNHDYQGYINYFESLRK